MSLKRLRITKEKRKEMDIENNEKKVAKLLDEVTKEADKITFEASLSKTKKESVGQYNMASFQRLRKSLIKLEKLGKHFRKESIQLYKNTKPKRQERFKQ